MAVPISVGDAILLSRIAYNLGKAFTSGRKSAPAEFTEIQDLLYTLSGALKLLARDLPDHAVGKGQRSSEQGTEEINEEDALLSQMIVSCRTTLSYLNVLVEKYMDLDTNATHQSNERHWKDEIRKNWKKILWTKEGGDISKLKVTLSAHINGLNLAVGAINKKHGVAIRDDIGIVRSQLGDICAWFQQNLEGTQVSSVSKAPQQQRGTTNDGTLTFTVSIHKLPGKEHLRLHCPRASFRVGWLDSSDLYQRTTSIFECHCDQLPGRRSHLEELHITLSPSSLLVHLAQSSGRQWQMSAAAKILPNRSNYVYISDVEPSRISEFEEQASILAICQAKAYLERGRSSGLVSIQLYMTDEGIVSILDSKTEVHAEADEEESCRITFRVGEQRFVVAANSVYSILHYKSLSESIVRAMTDIARASSVIIHQPTAEFVFQRFRGRATFLDEMDTQYYISFHHDTHIELGENHRTVKLSAVLCVSEEKRADGSAQVEQVKSSSVEVEFNDVKDASECLKSLQIMQGELLAIYLQNPRCGEHVFFRRFIGDLQLRDHILPSAYMAVVLDPLTERYRIIVRSKDHSIAVCMELSHLTVKSLTTDPHTSTREYPAYFIFNDSEGTDIEKHNLRLDELIPHRRGEELHPLLGKTEAGRSGPVGRMLEEM